MKIIPGYNADVTNHRDSEPSIHPLEPPSGDVRSWFSQATERILRQLETLADQPAASFDDREAVASLARQDDWPSAEAGTTLGFEQALDLVFDRLAPTSFNNPGPGFLAYVPGGGLVHSALADLISDVLNRYLTIWQAAPGLAQLEANVVRWICSMFGYGEGSGGYLSSGGSMANLSAVVAARVDRLGEDFLRGTIYASVQAHHSVAKAASLAGFPARNVRKIDVDGSFRLRTGELKQHIERDVADGFEPFLVVANAGSTDVGAVDPLDELADLCAGTGPDQGKLWLHVDAAYGGFFALTERGQAAFDGIHRADSITLDPHKGLFLPYGTGCLVAKDVQTLYRAHSGTADYMPRFQDDVERPDFCALSPELSRDFRGLRVWLPLAMVGVEAFRDALDEKLDLACWACDELRTLLGIEIVAEPQLSILAFRLVEPAEPAANRETNERLLDAINRRGRVFLSGTRLGEHFVLRLCILNFRTHRDRLEMCLEDIREAIAEVNMARQNSFDIVSEVDLAEVKNAVNQASKEISQRYDLKSTNSQIELNEKEHQMVVEAPDEYVLKQVLDVLQQKLIRRGISLKALSYGSVEPAAGARVRQTITLQQGIPQDQAKEIVKSIKGTKLKVQVAIQGDTVRVSGKDRDTLQEVIGHLKNAPFDIDMQFTNYR